jgi:hypothetical protein
MGCKWVWMAVWPRGMTRLSRLAVTLPGGKRGDEEARRAGGRAERAPVHLGRAF